MAIEGGPAFPVPMYPVEVQGKYKYVNVQSTGLTRRDYFAAAWLTGMANYMGRDGMDDTLATAIAGECRTVADAMIAVLDK